MKTLFQIKETSASGVKRCGRVLSLIAMLIAISASAVADTYYLRNGRQNNPSVAVDFQWSDAATSSTNEYTWTITPMSTWDLYIWFSTTNNDNMSGLVDLASYTLNDPDNLQTQHNSRDYNGKHGVYMHLNNVSQLTITWNKSTNVITLGTAKSSFNVSTASEHGTFDPTSATVVQGGSAVFTFTPEAGYSYASHSVSPNGVATVTRDGNTFTVAPTSNCTLTVVCSAKSYTVNTLLTGGSIAPTSATVTHGGSKTFTVTIPDGKQIDKTNTNYSGSAEISYEGDEITLNNVQSAGTLTVAFSSTSDKTPVVYWEKYPTIGNNTINMYGYLAERWCENVSGAGFYWKETNDITAADIATPAENHKFPAGSNPTKNNDSFSRTTPDLSEIITEPTTIYLVNYVTTNGGTGISDVVALAYSPCFPVSSVTLNNSAVSLPEGYKFTFEALARSAGKSPVYEWYLDDVIIEGATGNTYEFTMDAANEHTLKVNVTGDCDVSLIATAEITSCSVPEITLDATPASATPWTMVTVTANGANGNIGTGLWSVTPDAELKNGNYEHVEFRAGTPGTYTVKYVGISSSCTAADVRVEAEREITISADSEDCENPNAPAL